MLTNTPAYAGPVTIGNVIQLVSSYQNPPSSSAGSFADFQHACASTTASSPIVNSIDGSAVSLGPNSLLNESPLIIRIFQTVTVLLGEVEAAVCDCGFVTVGGGFPKWPLLFLAGIPLFFIDKDTEDKIIPNQRNANSKSNAYSRHQFLSQPRSCCSDQD